jgi:5-methyltetrahydrofolate--homocysteine methyltransferase
MGTLLQAKLPGFRGCFELLNIEQPAIVADIHSLYIDAGAELIETNTFGANVIKLSEYGLSGRCREINREAARLAKKAAGSRAFVGGDISSAGKLIEPMGEATYDEIYASFKEQIIGLEEGGADLLIIETMTDVQEARIALNAAKAHSKLPVLCSISFEENGSTISGSSVLSGLATLAAHGADIVGANCGLGPVQMISIFKKNIEEIKSLGVPLSVWSNAGLPSFVDGKTVFPLGPDAFGDAAAGFADLGFAVIGGCCGTTPEHIRALSQRLSKGSYSPVSYSKHYRYATSRFTACDLSAPRHGIISIGERLNPTARKKFAEELRAGSTAFLREESKAQEGEGADLLDINVGTPGIDEIAAMKNCVSILSNTVRTPLMIDSDNAEVLETALKIYPGCAVVNSINGKKKSIDTVLPVIKRYGCFITALCLDESGIFREADRRIEIGDRLVALLEENGISRERIIVDPLMLSESAEPGAAVETLKVIRHFASRGIKTSLGISNVSFGMPSRKFINNAFQTLAREEGLSAGIVNTKASKIISSWSEEETAAKAFLLGADHNGAAYIAKVAGIKEQPVETSIVADPLSRIKKLVIDGDLDRISDVVKEAMLTYPAETIMNAALICGLEEVGDRYSRGEYFLPQMIASANAMKNGFLILKPVLAQKSAASLGRVIICTVYGDIHDIGKNIVAMMLENHGFEVYDLGKDVPSEKVVAEAKVKHADLICLSSLLTTTMGEMKNVSTLMKDAGLSARLMVGGAVVTDEYAQSIGAHFSKDAVEAAALAKKLMKKD